MENKIGESKTSIEIKTKIHSAFWLLPTKEWKQLIQQWHEWIKINQKGIKIEVDKSKRLLKTNE